MFIARTGQFNGLNPFIIFGEYKLQSFTIMAEKPNIPICISNAYFYRGASSRIHCMKTSYCPYKTSKSLWNENVAKSCLKSIVCILLLSLYFPSVLRHLLEVDLLYCGHGKVK